MRRTLIIRFFRIPLFVILFCGVAGSLFAQGQRDTLRIGINITPSDSDDLPQLNSARMAVDEINGAGGVLGKTLFLDVYYNSTRKLEEAKDVMDYFRKKGIENLIITRGSGYFLEVVQHNTGSAYNLVASSATSVEISALNDNNSVWRTIPSDRYQGKIAASVFKEEKKRNIAILALDNTFGRGLVKTFINEVKKHGGKILTIVTYPELPDYAQYSFAGKIDSLFAQKPDAIYLVTYEEDGVKIIQEAQKKGLLSGTNKPLIVGCDAVYNSDFLVGNDPEVLETMKGVVNTNPKNSKNFQKFSTSFKTFTPKNVDQRELAEGSLTNLLDVETTNTFAATCYDAVYVLAIAMQKAGSPKAEHVRSALASVTNKKPKTITVGVQEWGTVLQTLKNKQEINYDGASGALEFDKHGDVTSGSYLVWKITNGKFVPVKTVQIPH